MDATDRHGIYRTEDGILLNTDTLALSAYKKQKRIFKEMNERNERIDRMEDDINEIKGLLSDLLVLKQDKENGQT